jgi:tryptophanyl-tRNA synthetase
VEITREIARRFNSYYRNIFPEPEGLLTDFPVLQGLDGRKMSKSYGNIIALADPPDEIRRKVATMVTDPARVKRSDPGHPEICPVYHYYQIFSPGRSGAVEQECRSAKRGCVECKKELAQVLIDYLAPLNQRRRQIEQDEAKLNKILAAGAEQARQVAGPTLTEAKQAMGLI